MGSDDNCDLDLQQRNGAGGSLLNSPSSGIYTNPQPGKVVETSMNTICESSNGGNSFFNTGWDPILSLAQNGEFKGPSMASQHHQIPISPYSVYGNQGIDNSSGPAQFPTDPRFVGLAPKFPCFGSGNFFEVGVAHSLPECSQNSNSGCPSNYTSVKEGATGNNFSNSSPNEKKRKRVLEYNLGKSHQNQFNSVQNEVEAEKQKDVSEGTPSTNEQNGKKLKTGKNPATNSPGNSNGKQVKDSSQHGQAPKEDYIHVRARRGQATNSHSLAERVRRERISERMKLLQDLVPGCNKITGKAVMLDEIINYVQSLQQQVEFLSMKLSTVNPELNFDVEQILSKDVLHSRGLGSAILGFGPGATSSLPPSHINPQGTMQATTNSQLPTMSQMPSSWENELQTMIQMGLTSSQALDYLGLNGNNNS